MRVQDSNVVIMGMGKSGQAAARLALARGAARVLCLDSNPDAVRVDGTLAHYGPHRRADIMGGPGGAWQLERPDFMVVSPGVPPTVDAIRDAATVGLPILGEIDFAARQCRRENKVPISFYIRVGKHPGACRTPLQGSAGASTCWRVDQRARDCSQVGGFKQPQYQPPL